MNPSCPISSHYIFSKMHKVCFKPQMEVTVTVPIKPQYYMWLNRSALYNRFTLKPNSLIYSHRPLIASNAVTPTIIFAVCWSR